MRTKTLLGSAGVDPQDALNRGLEAAKEKLQGITPEHAGKS
jgi:hypothetical protein